jgi:hypothetical protein
MLNTTTFRATTDFYDSAYIPRMGELVTAGSPPTRSTTNGTTVPAADSMSATKARVWQRAGKAGKEGGGQGEREERKDEMKDEMEVSWYAGYRTWHAGYRRRIPPEMASTTVTNVDKETTADNVRTHTHRHTHACTHARTQARAQTHTRHTHAYKCTNISSCLSSQTLRQAGI